MSRLYFELSFAGSIVITKDYIPIAFSVQKCVQNKGTTNSGKYSQNQSMRACLQFKSRNLPNNIQVCVTVNQKDENPRDESMEQWQPLSAKTCFCALGKYEI